MVKGRALAVTSLVVIVAAAAYVLARPRPHAAAPAAPRLAGAARPPNAPAVPATSSCGCPTLPVVATSKNPTNGHVYNELSEIDLEALYSNRDVLYGGSWDKGFHRLAEDLDPDSRLKIFDGASEPPVHPEAPIEEGSVSSWLLTGQVPRTGSNGWRSNNPSAGAIEPLVATLARINKYGEPSIGLRAYVLRAARFLTNDLANVPAAAITEPPSAGPPTGAGTRGVRARSLAFQARAALINLIVAVDPFVFARDAANSDGERIRRVLGTRQAPGGSVRAYNGPAQAGRSELLPLDGFDMANAALDVLLSIDDKGATSGVFEPREDDRKRLVDALVQVASGRRIFSGTATPNSVQDAVACKAYNTLVAIAATESDKNGKFREHLLDGWGAWSYHAIGSCDDCVRASFPFNRSAAIAAGAAMIATGVANAAEAKKLAHATTQIALGHVSSESTPYPRLDVLLATMKGLEGHVDGTAPEYNEWFHEVSDRLQTGHGSTQERRLLDLWNSGQVSAFLVPASAQPCKVGVCEPDNEPATLGDETWDTMQLLVFRPTGQQAVPVDATIDSLLQGEEFYLDLLVPIDEARASSADALLRNARTGQTQTVHLDRRTESASGSLVTYSSSNRLRLTVATLNGDTIVATAPGAEPAWVDFFTNDFTRTIDHSMRSLRAIELEQQAAIGTKANQALVTNKLRMIANARLLLDYKSRPDDRFFFTDQTRALIGRAYMQLLGQSSFDQGILTGDTFTGADRRFPGVTYVYREESQDVNRAVALANEPAKNAVLQGWKDFAIGMYRTALTAQCFELGGVLCPENYWVLTTQSTITGEQMSAEDYAMYGINLAVPLVFQGAQKLATLQYYGAAQYAPSAAQKELAATGPSADAPDLRDPDTILVDRRSQQIAREEAKAGLAGAAQKGEVMLGNKRAFFVLPSGSRFRGARILIPQDMDPSTPRNYQVTDDTCLLTAYEEGRRAAGQKPRTWKQSIDLAYERSVTIDAAGHPKIDLIYRPASVADPELAGTYMHKFDRYLELDGAEVLKMPPGHRYNVADLQLALNKNRQVIVRVKNLGTEDTHALLVRGIRKDSEGTKFIRYFEPAHGFDEEVDLCEFLTQWDRTGVKIFRFPKKVR